MCSYKVAVKRGDGSTFVSDTILLLYYIMLYYISFQGFLFFSFLPFVVLYSISTPSTLVIGIKAFCTSNQRCLKTILPGPTHTARLSFTSKSETLLQTYHWTFKQCFHKFLVRLDDNKLCVVSAYCPTILTHWRSSQYGCPNDK